MNILPFEKIVYRTKLHPDEVINRLKEHVEPNQLFRTKFSFSQKEYKDFEGTINGKSFSIQRIIEYRNSFVPQIRGVVSQDLKGTKIEVTMQLHVVIMIFLSIWCTGVGLAFVGMLYQSIQSGTWDYIIAIPLGMFLFAVLLVTFGFKSESHHAHGLLQKVFQAEKN